MPAVETVLQTLNQPPVPAQPSSQNEEKKGKSKK